MEIKNPANFRDLGGIAGADGKRVKPGRLLRSGELYGLSRQEKDALVNEYHLKTVVDFRTAQERENHPDDDLPGVRNLPINIIDTPEKAASMENFLKISSEEEVIAFMRQIYEVMATDAGAQRGFARFLRLAVEQKEGAILFHCFAGKDRAGMGAALLLTLLGASREDVMADYLKTNEMRKAANDQILDQLKKMGKTPEELKALNNLLLVRAEYMERVFQIAEERYGSVESYIRRTMGVTDADIASLRENYLEA